MALSETQQLQHVFEVSKNILITLNPKQSADAICAALAWKIFFEKQGKQVDVVADNFVPPKNLNFVKGINEIKPTISHLQKFIIKVDVSKAKIDTLSYDVKDDTLSIYLTPKQGIISKNELRTAQSAFKYDLIITINAQDLESLGAIFLNNTDLFYRQPIVNFDHLASNEHFGQLNFVDLTATATSEVVFKTISQLGEAYIDDSIATALLTGIIGQTHSFRSNNVKPYTLTIASKLINLGADRDMIIKNLYHTKPLSSLKLWGQALTHLESDRALGLAWTILTREDFSRTGASPEDLNGLIDELISNSPEAKMILLLYEDVNSTSLVHGILTSETGSDAKSILAQFHPEGNKKTATFAVQGKTIKEVELEIRDIIQKNITSIK